MNSPLRLFLSHNSADKDYVRPLAAALQLAGASVWFDEWAIRPGDSITAAISDGLSTVDVFVLIWSAQAVNSPWVASELNSALSRCIADGSRRFIPVRLDETPLPELMRHLAYIDGTAGHLDVARKILGINSEREFRRAVQLFIMEADLDFTEIWGIGFMTACPGCGGVVANLKGWEYVDDDHDRRYAGVKCTECGWEDGGEI